MILDFISQCTSIVKCSKYDNLNLSLLSDNYTIKNNEFLSWKLTSIDVSAVEFKILSPTTKILKNFLCQVNSANVKITIEVSLDYINWYELKYKTDIDNKYLYIKVPTGYYNLTTKELITDINEIINLKYVFIKTNEFNNEQEYIYNNLEFKYIKVRLEPISGPYLPASTNTPLFFTYFNIYIDEDFDSTSKNLLEIKSSMLYKQKYFEEQDFYPDLITNYMKMLEESVISTDNFNNSLVQISSNDGNSLF